MKTIRLLVCLNLQSKPNWTCYLVVVVRSPDSGQDTSELEYSLRLRDPNQMDQTSEGE